MTKEVLTFSFAVILRLNIYNFITFETVGNWLN